MSQIPRRTSEFQSSSLRKSANPRPSRLAQPSSSSAIRPSNLPRTSSTLNMNRMTPSRTPSRSNSARTTIFPPMTAEKEKAPVEDRVFVAEKSQQVLDALANHSDFAELLQKGLKAMTHKQFIMILQLFLKPIVGTNVNIDATNYVEYVYTLVTSQLDYPYTINKSSLKTPSAPHCQNSIIILLAWLTEFVVYQGSAKSVEYCATEEFESPDFTKNFMFKMGEAFVFWNNQDESEDAKIKEMSVMYLKEKLGQGVSIETEVDRLKASIEQLQRESQPVSLMKELEEKYASSKQLKNKIKELGRINNGLSEKIYNMEADLCSKNAAKDNTKLELINWRKQVLKQGLTQDERMKLLVEITELKSLLESKRTDGMEVAESSSEREIKLSNLIQKKFHLIDKLNNSIYILASDLQVSGMREKFDPTLFEIKTTNIGDAVSLDAEIEHLKCGLADLNSKYQHAIDSITKAKSDCEAEENRLTTELNLVAEDLKKVTSELDKVSGEKLQVEAEFESFIQSSEQIYQLNASQLEEITEKLQKHKRNIETYHKYNAQMVEDKENFKKYSLAKIKSLYEKRKQEVDENRQKLNEMKTFLTEFAKAQKPVPENVQSIVNDVLKRRDMNIN